MLALKIYTLEELIPVISISVSICIFTFALLRLTARHQAIIHKQEWFSLLWLSLAGSLWAATALFKAGYFSYYSYLAGMALMFGFSYYTLNLLWSYTGNKKYMALFKITGLLVLVTAAASMAFKYLTWWNIVFTVIAVLFYGLNTILFIRFFISGFGRYYRFLALTFSAAVVLIILSTLTTFYNLIAHPGFFMAGVFILILAAGANTLERSNLVTLKDLNRELHKVKQQFESETENIEDVVIFLARTIDAKDKYTEGHIERVSQYAMFLGERLGLDENKLDTLRIGALIHDIGKICIDLSILHKPDKLNVSEYAQIQQHPILGEQICSPLKALRDAGTIVRCHHEKLDGSGYPDGISGDAIGVETRIVTIADIFDALTTERSYRKALTVEEAFAIMQQEASQGKLDAMLVNEFFAMLADMEILSRKYTGTNGVLSW